MTDLDTLEYTNHLEVIVPGEPKALPRHRHTKTGHTYELAWSKQYKADLLAQVAPYAKNTPWTGPLIVLVEFWLHRPKSRTVKNPDRATQERLTKHMYPTSRPDLDNYGKMILDALHGIFKDDSQVVDMQMKKRYTPEEGYTKVSLLEVRPPGKDEFES